MSSLKQKLFIRLSILIMITLAVVGILAYRSVHESIADNYDDQLITDCNVLWLLTKDGLQQDHHSPEEINTESTIQLQTEYQESIELYGNWHAFRIWKGNEIIVSSDNAPDKLPPVKDGLSDIAINGRIWRVYSLHIPKSDAIVEAFEDLESRKTVENDILLGLIVPLLFMVPLVGWMLFYGINSGLRGLQRFAREIEIRSPDDLSPIEVQSAPKELKPLMGSLNTLFEKLDKLLHREREFIDNAAHALRTPISALKIQGNLLQDSTDAKEHDGAIKDIQLGINRVSKLIQQLLILSKLDHSTISLSNVDLYSTTQSVLMEISPLALDKEIELSLDANGSVQALAEPELLRILILSIVENAIKYTGIGGKVNIKITNGHKANILEIKDNGPGIPKSEQSKVFYRFYRMPNTMESGSGLGLAIAKSIAGIFHTSIDIGVPEDGKGTIISIKFPVIS